MDSRHGRTPALTAPQKQSGWRKRRQPRDATASQISKETACFQARRLEEDAQIAKAEHWITEAGLEVGLLKLV
jgi:hypothetical protein